MIKEWLRKRTLHRVKQIVRNRDGVISDVGFDQHLQGTCWSVGIDDHVYAVVVDLGSNAWYIIPNPTADAVGTAYAASLLTTALGNTNTAMIGGYWLDAWERPLPSNLVVLPGGEEVH